MMGFSELVDKMSRTSKGLGELLRTVTFRGEGCGCYENFDVRSDAAKWSEDQLNAFIVTHLRDDEHPNNEEGRFISSWDLDYIRPRMEGYTFTEDGLTIDVFWYWDGDGTLAFQVRQDGKVKHILVHHDCKNDYEWENITPTDPEELRKYFEQNKSYILDNAV